MSVVSPDTLLEELPGDVFRDIENCLNENDTWRRLAEGCRNGYGDPMFNQRDIMNMERNVSPARTLLDKFIQMNIRVEEFQDICMLGGSDLHLIHDKVVTNVPMEIFHPEEEQTLMHRPGEKIDLCVEAYGSPLPMCQWYHNNQVLPGQTSFTLTIDSFSERHEGVYYCLLRQTLKAEEWEKASCNFCLSMEATPPRIVTDLPEEISVTHHESLELAFDVESSRPPRVYTWYKDDDVYSSHTEPRLRMSRVDALNEGQYHCVVETDDGSCSTRKARVRVLGNPWSPDRPQIIEQPVANASYIVNDKVHLTCRVQCCLPVTFTCFLNNTVIKSDERETIISCSSYDKDNHMCELSYEITEDNMERLAGKLKFHFEAASSVDRVLTQDVHITVKPTHGRKTYYARNKWALLVGNANFQSSKLKNLSTPFYDVMTLADELRNLGFRVLALTNLEKNQFINALHNFSKIVQKDDYVVFYFAGHGFSIQKFDYMVPVDAVPETKEAIHNAGRTEYTMLQYDQCVDVNEVAKHLQRTRPALILYIFDMCRHYLAAPPSDLPNSSLLVDAKANSYAIYATSLKYSAQEVSNEMSCLMEQLKSLIGTKVSVEQLGQRFKELFRRKEALQGVQIPRIEGDLAEPRSLTDIARPTAQDRAVGGVLDDWNRLSSVGCPREKEVKMKNGTLKIDVRCRHWNQNDSEGHTWIVGNRMKVVVTFIHSGLLSNTQPGVELNITIRKGDKLVKKDTVKLVDILKKEEYAFTIYQEPLVISISSEDNKALDHTFRLDLPSVSSMLKKPVTVHHQRNI